MASLSASPITFMSSTQLDIRDYAYFIRLPCRPPRERLCPSKASSAIRAVSGGTATTAISISAR